MLTREHAEDFGAIEIKKETAHFFLSGPAGTGKTFLYHTMSLLSTPKKDCFMCCILRHSRSSSSWRPHFSFLFFISLSVVFQIAHAALHVSLT